MSILIVGKRILGLEFFFAVFSYFYLIFTHHYVLMQHGQLINFFFYLFSFYQALLFCGLVQSNPGQLADQHKRIINQSVSLPF